MLIAHDCQAMTTGELMHTSLPFQLYLLSRAGRLGAAAATGPLKQRDRRETIERDQRRNKYIVECQNHSNISRSAKAYLVFLDSIMEIFRATLHML